jgi:hypothetical protein
MTSKALRTAIGASLVAVTTLLAFAPDADASYRARSTRGGFDAIMGWFEDLFGAGDEADAGPRMDDNGAS